MTAAEPSTFLESKAPDTARHRALPWLALVLMALAMFIPGFFSIPPIDRDEARFAQASRQMVESGDYIDIRFQDEPRHKKPIGIYWFQSASAHVFGADDIWAYRLPSLLGAVSAVLLTAWIGRSLFGSTVGMLAGVVMASTILLGVEARMAKTDAALLAAILLGQGALAKIYLARRAEQRVGWGTALLFWAAQGLGILIKGPVILLFSAGTLMGLALWDRRIKWMASLRPLAGSAVTAAMVLPWLIAIWHATDGQFFREAIGHDLLGKVARGQESHGAPPGTYLAAFWLTFWPFSLIAGLALPWAWRNRADPRVRFCICWIVPAWILFEAMATKLPHYVLPTYPAIALLTVAAALAFAQERNGKRLRMAVLIPCALFLAVGAALSTAGAFVSLQVANTLPVWTAVAGAAGLSAVVAGVYLLWRRQVLALFATLPVAAFVLYAALWQGLLPSLDGLWISREVAAKIDQVRPCQDVDLASAGYSEPSLVFLTGTDTRFVGGATAAQHLLDHPDCGLSVVVAKETPAFEKHLRAAGASATVLATVEGFNYSRGNHLNLALYVLEN